jgi:hypothetical protein
VEVDVEGSAVTGKDYHRKICIRRPIAGQAGRRTFRRNSFAGTCSLLEPLDGAVEAFGMERYCTLVERIEFECDTIPSLLRKEQIKSLDFLKTDVEGLDCEIVRSCEEFLGKTLFIQCELRFRPFYQTEPYFHETVTLLARHGYEVLDIIHIDRWQYKTPNRRFQMQGRAQWADFLFVLQPERLAGAFENTLPEAVAKQVILACMLGKKKLRRTLALQIQKFPARRLVPRIGIINTATSSGRSRVFHFTAPGAASGGIILETSDRAKSVCSRSVNTNRIREFEPRRFPVDFSRATA